LSIARLSMAVSSYAYVFLVSLYILGSHGGKTDEVSIESCISPPQCIVIVLELVSMPIQRESFGDGRSNNVSVGIESCIVVQEAQR